MPGVCSRCLREVYFAEQKLALGKVWHTFCFTCRNCRKLLDSCTIATHSREVYCRNCYSQLFSESSCSVLSVSTHGNQEIITKRKNRETLPLKDSSSDYSSDFGSCYCCENSLSSNKEDIPNLRACPLEKPRFRGGGEHEEKFHLEGISKCCERENANLGVLGSLITYGISQKKSSNVGHWINRNQSASERFSFIFKYPKIR
ncbi:LIM domain-containing protein PLIM2c-like [Belonocnema kinseyi]|uniref:LIM domain-containing protein PLIM2c-like n=1 Tax=Belonocnema kinseyi TaxID=2817044 RepID=UPI00143DD383|nr:LIM domain-containing protein PLIM2c-like [Belonocnema kinseyi]